MLKSTAGGGGIGIRLCASPAELHEAFDVVARLSQSNFGSGDVSGTIRFPSSAH